jgi:hypothetical protein
MKTGRFMTFPELSTGDCIDHAERRDRPFATAARFIVIAVLVTPSLTIAGRFNVPQHRTG